MEHAGLAINEIIVRTLAESSICKDKLEIEESGRVVANLQGLVSGYRIFISFLAAEFHISQSALEYNGDVGFEIPKITDLELSMYQIDIEGLKITEAWKNVLERIEKNTEQLKNNLLFNAEKSRDLDYSQGQYKATNFYKEFFVAIDNEVGRREKERDERRKKPGLFDAELDAAQNQEGFHSSEFKKFPALVVSDNQESQG